MSKKPMTWLELIKMKLKEEKDKGKSPSIGDVTPLAKKEWVQIKEGKHPLYVQGKAQTFARKKKGDNKSRKNSKASSSPAGTPNADIQQLLSEIKVCGKCKSKIEKHMKKMKGGGTCGQAGKPLAVAPQTGGMCGSCGGSNLGGGCGCAN